ncbi:MAG: DUF309 domain-containing protein [Planctomycetota bacterium]|jgi:hypothetical protein
MHEDLDDRRSADREPPLRLCPEVPLPDAPYRPGTEDRRPELPELSDADPWPRSAVVRFGLDLLNHGFPWEAHEVWERPWRARRTTDPAGAELLQTLIQLAAARVLARDGRTTGARRVVERALAHLAASRTEAPRFGLAPEEIESALLDAPDSRQLPVPPLVPR